MLRTPMSAETPALFPLRVELPLPGASQSRKSDGRHWATQNTDYQSWKAIAHYTFLNATTCARPRYPDAVYVAVEWYQHGRQHTWPDTDNITRRIGAYLDALQSAGIVVNDRQVADIHVERYWAIKGTECVRLTVWDADTLERKRLLAGPAARTMKEA